jgi:hypothetical protein
MTPKREFVVEPAVREQVPLLIGIVGSSGSGKTFSALRLATGIARVIPGPIVLIDTENRRSLHYADQFKFMHVPFPPPFGAQDYLAALHYAASLKPSCIIVDSASHEHIGEGGLLDAHDKILDRMAGDDHARREKSSMAAWAKVKPLRTSLIEGIKQISGAMIFCWRGQEKLKPMKDSKGRMELVSQGLMAIGGKEFIYEMTINCLLQPRSDGVPDWTGTEPGERLEMKLPQQFRDLFKPGTVLNEDIGRAMAEWARGGVPSRSTGPTSAPATSPPSSQPSVAGASPAEMALRGRLEAEISAAAAKGELAYEGALTIARPQCEAYPNTARYLARRKEHWLAIAREADQLAQGGSPDPAHAEREAAALGVPSDLETAGIPGVPGT